MIDVQCPRCLKHSNDVHTCTPTDAWRILEQDRNRLLLELQAARNLDLKTVVLLKIANHNFEDSGNWKDDARAFQRWAKMAIRESQEAPDA